MRLRTVCTAAAGAVSGLPALNRGASSAISVEREIDPGSHAAAVHELAAANDAHGPGPRRDSRADRATPNGWSRASPQKCGGAEYKRAGADRSDEPRPVRLALDERDRGLVGHQDAADDLVDDLVLATCVRAIERADQFALGTRLNRWPLQRRRTERLQCAKRGHSATAWRTGQIDPNAVEARATDPRTAAPT
jgi:hypothetical protein